MKYGKNFKLDLSLINKYGVVLLVFVTLLMTGTASNAATYYVATDGSDSSQGTESQPFRTIKKGIRTLRAGDTLYIRSGTYTESLYNTTDPATDRIASGTSWSNPVRIAAYPGETVTMAPSSTVSSVVTLSNANLRYIIFDGIIFDGTNTIDQTFYIGSGANHIRIINSELKQGSRHNLTIGYGGDNLSSDDNEFINLNIHDTQTSHGIYFSGGSRNLIENCSVYNSVGYGIHIYTDVPGQSANYNIVRNNKIYNNGMTGTYRNRTTFAIILSAGDGNMAYNNVIWNNAAGIAIDYRGSNTKIYNNTVYANSTGGYAGIAIGTGSSGAIVKNNIIFSNTGTISNWGSGTVTSNNLTTDPKFVNAAADDFRLQSTSPAIDGGVTLAEVTGDFGGVSRPQGSAYDIGAYEYRVATQAPPPSPPVNLVVTP